MKTAPSAHVRRPLSKTSWKDHVPASQLAEPVHAHIRLRKIQRVRKLPVNSFGNVRWIFAENAGPEQTKRLWYDGNNGLEGVFRLEFEVLSVDVK
ncbi:hypothetical protein D3C85_1504200 [compost metagenome]